MSVAETRQGTTLCVKNNYQSMVCSCPSPVLAAALWYLDTSADAWKSLASCELPKDNLQGGVRGGACLLSATKIPQQYRRCWCPETALGYSKSPAGRKILGLMWRAAVGPAHPFAIAARTLAMD